MNRNTIIYVGGFGLPDRTASAQRSLENARLFQLLGYEVLMLGKIFQHPPATPEEAASVHGFNGIRCQDIRHANGSLLPVNYLRDIVTIRHAVESIGSEKVLAIVAYNHPPIALYRINNFARRVGIATVAECTEWHGIEGKGILRNLIRWVQTETRMRYVAPRTGNIICASKYLQSWYKKQNTVVLPFVVDKHDEKWCPDLLPRPRPEVRRFVYVGSPGVGMCKDQVHRVLLSFACLRKKRQDFEFVVVGITEADVMASFPGLRSTLEHLQDSVQFLGRVTHAEAIQNMASADFSVFLRPRNRVSAVGFPTKLVEAFSCGVPTITNRTSDIDQYLIQGTHGFLLDEPDVEKLALVLEQALELDDKQLAEMKNRCREDNPFHLENFRSEVSDFLQRAGDGQSP